MKKYLASVFLILSLIIPAFLAVAQTNTGNGLGNNTGAYREPAPSGLASGCNRGEPVRKEVKDASGKITSTNIEFVNSCGFNDLMAMANRLINFVLFVLATPMVALGLCYAGFLYLFSGGSSEKVGQAKSIMSNLIIGYVVACIAWIAVKTIMVSLGFDSTGIFLQI